MSNEYQAWKGAVEPTAPVGGAIQAAATIAFSESAALKGSMLGSTSIAFSATAQHNRMFAATSVAFSDSATLTSNKILGATSIAFSISAAPIQPLVGTTSIAFSESATLGGGSRWDISPLVLPASRYTFSAKPPGTIKALAEIDFTTSATLTGSGGLGGNPIRATVTIDVIGPQFVWLFGTGALKGTPSIAFSEQAQLVSLQGATSIAWSVSATLTAGGALAGVASVAFSETGALRETLGIQGSTSVAFSESGIARNTGAAKSTVSIDFTSTGKTKGTLASTAAIAFTAAGDNFNEAKGELKGSLLVKIGPPQTFGGLAGSVSGLLFSESARLRNLGQPDSKHGVFFAASFNLEVYPALLPSFLDPDDPKDPIRAASFGFSRRAVFNDTSYQSICMNNALFASTKRIGAAINNKALLHNNPVAIPITLEKDMFNQSCITDKTFARTEIT